MTKEAGEIIDSGQG